MASRVGDTVVVCRPDQLREAAIVLSCFPGDRVTPLVVVEPPPISEDEYRQRYAQYRDIRNERDTAIGGALGRRDVLRGVTTVVSNDAVDLKTQALTSYRSWWKHQRLIADLLAGLALRRAVLLFEPASDELTLINAIPVNDIPDERSPLLPENVELVRLAGHSLPSLAEAAWQALRRGGAMSNNGVDVPEDDVAAYFAGLFRALQLGVPLRPAAPTPQMATAGDQTVAVIGSPSEAVVIETSTDATRLLGVLYAHHQRARLVLYPEPDVSPIEAARAEMERRQKEAAKSAKGQSPRELLRALRDYFRSDAATAGIRRIEQAVAAVVPNEVVEKVGELDLTVFTSGIPYNFVRKCGADWSTKPIGHVTGDASLLVLTELCGEKTDAGVGFSALFDPGYFETSETRDVLSVLRKRVAHPLVLNEDASSSVGLMHLAETLPLDLLFFNTHGSDDAITLRDMRFPAYKLVQRLTLKSRPFVFNSSCLSWVGVGREFVRAGARGYVGTLWSIDAEMAATYARTVFQRITREEWPVSRAMRETGVDPASERAYIFVGTVGAKLHDVPLGDADAERQRAVAAVRMLLESTLHLFRQTSGYMALPFATSLEDLLWTEAEVLIARLDHRWPTAYLDRVEVSIRLLCVLSHLVHRRREDVVTRLGLIDDTARLLDALPIDDRTRMNRRADLLQYAGRIHVRLGHVPQAVELLQASVQAAEQAGASPGPSALELSDALKTLGRLKEARDAAEKAERAYCADSAGTHGRLLALGRVGQLCIWLGDYAAAGRDARVGFVLAVKQDDLREQGTFKSDEARAQLALGQYDDALEAAKAALQRARWAHDDVMEVKAYGVITRALIGKRDLMGALNYATTGLREARHRNFLSSIGDFLVDIAEIKTLSHDTGGAFEHLREAAPIFASTGEAVKVGRTLALASDLRMQLKTWDALASMVEMEVRVIDAVDATMRRQITTDVVIRVRDWISAVGPETVRPGLQALVRDIQSVLRERGSAASSQLVFISQALELFEHVAGGRIAAARRIAETLDGVSDRGFELARFVGTFG